MAALTAAALGGLVAKGGGLLKGAGAALKGWSIMDKLMLLYFGGSTVENLLGGRAEMGVQKAQLGLGSKQLELQAAIGKREEARTDKLTRQLIGEREKQYLREEKTATKKDIRASQERQTQMALAMLMALSGSQGEEARILSGPRPSTASMLSLMR